MRPSSSSYKRLAGGILLYLYCCFYVRAQTPSGAEYNLNDSLKIVRLIKTGDSLAVTNPDDALKYYQLADSLCLITGNEKLFLQMYSYYSWVLNNASRFKESLDICNRALQVAEKNKDSLQITYAHSAIGLVFVNLSSYQMALEHYLTAMDLVNAMGKHELRCKLYGKISGCYYPLKLYDKSLDYEMKALGCLVEKSDSVSLEASYFNIGLLLKDMGRYSDAEDYISKAEQLNQQLKNPITDCRIQFARASLSNMQKMHQQAILFAEKGIAKSKAVHFESGEAMNLTELGKAYLQLGRLGEAKSALAAGVQIAERNQLGEELLMALDAIRFAAAGLRDMKESAEYDRRYRYLSDSIFSQQSSGNIQALEAKYEAEKKQHEILALQNEKSQQDSALQKKNTLNLLLLGGSVLGVIIFFLSYRNHLQQRKLQQQRIAELEAEKKLAATEAVLKGEEQERARLAKDLHDGLGGMLSGIKYVFQNMKGSLVLSAENHQAFERGVDMLDSSIQEMRRVAHNMMPEALVKFGLDTALRDYCHEINQSGVIKISYQSIGIADLSISQTQAITIYRMVQELINNIIKHAGAGTAIVQLAMHSKQLAITVEDDGKGFDVKVLDRPKGIGWDNIRNRVRFLNAKLDIRSTAGKGTSVMIEVPEIGVTNSNQV